MDTPRLGTVPDPLAGLPQIVGFENLAVLGQGGSGVVIEARDLANDRIVALKVVRGLDGVLKQRFEREARLHLTLSHPNIAQAFSWGFGRVRDQGWIAFERLYGRDLSKVVHDPALDWRDRLRMLVAIARALQYGHERGIIHRDVKPQNVFLSDDGHVRLLDFGVAKVIDKPLTLTGRIVGTPAYLAPEFILELPVDHRADVFSLGVVAFQLLSGKKPWDADESHTLLIRICTVPPLALDAELRAGDDAFPAERIPHAAEVVHRAMSQDPEARPPNALALAEDFERLLADSLPPLGNAAAAADRSWQHWARARAARIEVTSQSENAPSPWPNTQDSVHQALERSRRIYHGALIGTSLLLGAMILLWLTLR